MLNTFITYQKQNVMQNFLRATVRRGYLTWILFKPMSVNASHRVIMMASFCSKCKESEQLDIFWPVRAKVLKHLYACGEMTHCQLC